MPQACSTPGHFAPCQSPGATAALFAILDANAWEAFPYAVRGPLQQAVRSGGGDEGGKPVTLAPSSQHAVLRIHAAKVGPVERLPIVAARQAFGTLPHSFLKAYSALIGIEEQTSLAESIVSLVRALLPEVSDEDLVKILNIRLLSFEEAADVRECLEDEAILEAFDPKDPITL